MAKLVQGGLKINQASDKLDELATEELKDKTAVIVHVGSCDFSVEDNKDIQNMYMRYTELVANVLEQCPNARVYVSGIPPRKGTLRDKVNRDIRRMNLKLERLAEEEENISFINNNVYLTDDSVTIDELYIDRDDDIIHINNEGKTRMASFMFDAIKNDHYRERLSSDWKVSV